MRLPGIPNGWQESAEGNGGAAARLLLSSGGGDGNRDDEDGDSEPEGVSCV
jgi:hypothetical protein